MESALASWLPFIALFVGVAVVVGLIIGMRINAFLALIVAALVVSFIAPGELGAKVSRVAVEFGKMAGNIGIVIALAAVIGKALMDSGAADRVVRAFVGGLGEKRASWALTGSGFVLAVPVFFDTVFYLLVPLARSLYRNTRKHFLKYVLAISAGGAVTHALVPPTPGPLLMAQLLDVDLGVMIGIGVLIGIPAAIAGLVFATWLDRRMPIEMRPLPGEEVETEHVKSETAETPPTEGMRLPPLGLALLPILLPVALICASTALETIANQERAASVSTADLPDPAAMREALAAAGEGLPLRISEAVDWSDSEAAAAGLNELLSDREIFGLDVDLSRLDLAWVQRENRLALEEMVPTDLLARHDWVTPSRRAAEAGRFFGNANFALLLSAVIALLLYVGYRRPSRKEFSDSIESALMSGGLIILITAAGGAFGAMLGAAGIGPAIAKLFASDDGTSAAMAGIGLLFLAFSISALLKVAQGSTTVAVITASGMIAAMLVGVDLRFHPVYLATAIGGGGLVGSWMNDSGFWIFSKMSGLTETEALKSWTPLLAILGITAFVFSVLLAFVMPMA